MFQDVMVLLDLLGTDNAPIPNYSPLNDPLIYNAFWDTELRLRQLPNCLDTSSSAVFSGYIQYGAIEDDHVPFHHRGKPLLVAI